jgi:lipoprotein-anchoring transpeptidase ErfK/SrfK
MTRRRRSRVLLSVSALVVALLAVLVVGALAYDGARDRTLAEGITVGGVDVGGLRMAAARERVQQRAVQPLKRTVQVRASGREFLLSAREAKLRVDVDAALDQALVASREGWLGERVWRGLTGGTVDRDVPLHRRVSSAAVKRFAAEVGDAVDRDAVSAAVEPHPDALSVTKARTGRSLDERALRRKVRATLTHAGRPTTIDAGVEKVAPKTTLADLRKRYDAYILIDRSAHKLRLYRHLALDRTYDIAVGKAGLETPAGLYDVQWKETNPIWRVPNSDWAGDLAGRNIPPGPDNPIKARWLAFNGAAGIHGIAPSEYGSIGHDASHGCVRMRIPDVIDVYAKTPVGSPVFVA